MRIERKMGKSQWAGKYQGHLRSLSLFKHPFHVNYTLRSKKQSAKDQGP